jgi:hypothetical protein
MSVSRAIGRCLTVSRPAKGARRQGWWLAPYPGLPPGCPPTGVWLATARREPAPTLTARPLVFLAAPQPPPCTAASPPPAHRRPALYGRSPESRLPGDHQKLQQVTRAPSPPHLVGVLRVPECSRYPMPVGLDARPSAPAESGRRPLVLSDGSLGKLGWAGPSRRPGP